MDPRRDPERLSLASYPLSHPVQARFSDLDGNGHLNNVALASFYEDARITLDWRIFTDGRPVPFEGFTFVVANISIHYLAEARYPATYVVGCGVSRIGTSSFVHSAGLFRDGVCFGLCDSILVHLVDVCYDVRGPVLDEATRLEAAGARILKLNIGNPAPFGFSAPPE
uniref:acyl-CoA thioesterase n=1 Tax=Frankia tisae TaxID=2950104 RepID=UPI0021BE4428